MSSVRQGPVMNISLHCLLLKQIEFLKSQHLHALLAFLFSDIFDFLLAYILLRYRVSGRFYRAIQRPRTVTS